jgi:hypothetical protein
LQQIGLGAKRIAGVRDALSGRLGRIGRRQTQTPDIPPDVAEILDVDHEYRSAAARGTLPTIAPRRFNPGREAWLPVLHTSRADRHYTALYSNTARAHELDRTRDWVVLYFYDDEHAEGQHTAVTETHGPLAGRRVVRGREAECGAYYRT